MPHTQLQQTFVGTVYMYVRGTACSLYIAHIIGVAKVYCSCSYLLSPHHLQTKLNVLAMRVDCQAARGSWLLVIETLLLRVQWSHGTDKRSFHLYGTFLPGPNHKIH